jgi:hypothetical protein
MRTFLQKPSVTQAQNMWMTENSFIHNPHIDRSEKSVINIQNIRPLDLYVDDGIYRPSLVSGLRHAWLFFNSEMF